MSQSALTYFVASQRVLQRFIEPPVSSSDDELIFIDFRPHWLRSQRMVYNALARAPCAICMFEVHPDNVVKQHNPHHPPLCFDCYLQLQVCPFCRVDLFNVQQTKPRMWIMRSNRIM